MTHTIEFTLEGGCKMTMLFQDISAVCEIKPTKGVKNVGKTNVKNAPDDAGWNILDDYATVKAAWEGWLNDVTG